MVVEALNRQAEALSEETDRPFEEDFAEVLKTRAGRQLWELANGPHRHERAAEWQAGLLDDREAKRPANLRESGRAGSRLPRLGGYVVRKKGTDGHKVHHA